MPRVWAPVMYAGLLLSKERLTEIEMVVESLLAPRTMDLDYNAMKVGAGHRHPMRATGQSVAGLGK